MLFFLALAVSLVSSKQVIIIGDSWGTKGGKELEAVFKEHGATWQVANYAQGGTTTADWAKNPNRMVNDINKNADAQYVWLTIGGNDAADYLPSCTRKHPLPDEQCINQVLNTSITNIEIMLNPVFQQHPNIQVVQFGYDLMNFQKGYCSLEGQDLMHGCNDQALCINTQFVKIQGAVDYMATQFANYTSINLLGSLELMDKSIPNVTLGNPNLNYWSPANLM
eukprot:UN05917